MASSRQVTQSESLFNVVHSRSFLLRAPASGCVSPWPHLPQKILQKPQQHRRSLSEASVQIIHKPVSSGNNIGADSGAGAVVDLFIQSFSVSLCASRLCYLVLLPAWRTQTFTLSLIAIHFFWLILFPRGETFYVGNLFKLPVYVSQVSSQTAGSTSLQICEEGLCIHVKDNGSHMAAGLFKPDTAHPVSHLTNSSKVSRSTTGTTVGLKAEIPLRHVIIWITGHLAGRLSVKLLVSGWRIENHTWAPLRADRLWWICWQMRRVVHNTGTKSVDRHRGP